MTTLAANKSRAFELGSRNAFGMIAADTVYEGAAVGLVPATGLARPLAAGDRFCGFAEATAANESGAAAAINVRVIDSGKIELAVAGATITDVGQPVFATDDDTFVFSPVAAVFVGFVYRFVSAGVVVVTFDAPNYRDPFGEYSVRETLSATKTLDIEDTRQAVLGRHRRLHHHPAGGRHRDQLQDRQRRVLRHHPGRAKPERLGQGPGARTCPAPTITTCRTPRRPRSAATSSSSRPATPTARSSSRSAAPGSPPKPL
jgi:hypothetical protein